MSLFSFLRKNKQEPASDDRAFYSRAEEDSNAVRGRSRRARNEPAADPVLPEKKRARRRLIGAVALVLAAVVGLPMMLDSEPQPLADDIAIHIPSKDKPVAEGSIGATDAAGPATSSEPKEETAERPRADDQLPAAAAAAAPRPEVKPAAESAKAAAVKPAVRANAKTETGSAKQAAEEARVRALLEGKPDPRETQKKSDKYVIQVAALATKEKVDELQAKLKDAGIKSYTQQVATAAGNRTRIRIGPFASKDEAETMRAKIVKLGLNGTLVPA